MKICSPHFAMSCGAYCLPTLLLFRLTSAAPFGLSQRLDPLSALPGVPSLELVPLAHTPSLHADHPLPRPFRSKVCHRPCFFVPRVPNHDVSKRVPYDFKFGLPVLGDAQTPCCWGRIHPVSLGREGDGLGGGFLVVFGRGHFVDV